MNTKLKYLKSISGITLGMAFCSLISLSSCSGIETPGSTKFIQEFHEINFEEPDPILPEGQLSLYVDFSTCNMLGQSSPFFQELTPFFS